MYFYTIKEYNMLYYVKVEEEIVFISTREEDALTEYQAQSMDEQNKGKTITIEYVEK